MIPSMSHQYFFIEIMEKLPSLQKRCALNQHKCREIKLAKSGWKTIQNSFSLDLFNAVFFGYASA